MTRHLRSLTSGLLSGAVYMLACSAAQAGTLTVVGPTNLAWNGGPSPRMTLSIHNPTANDEFVIGYQLDLELVPVENASEGILKFGTISVSDVNYVFEGNTLFDPQPTPVQATTVEDFMDFIADGNKTISANESFGLVTFDFDATGSPPVSGYFQVKLSSFGTFASWYFPDGGEETPFDNTPEGAEPAVVGIIGVNVEAQTQAVPEASTLNLAWAAVSLLLAGRSVRFIQGIRVYRAATNFYTRVRQSRREHSLLP